MVGRLSGAITISRGNKRVTQTKSVPAPIGGLNARDSAAQMPETDAYLMVNWFPGTTNIAVRGGSLNWATNLPAWVESLMAYQAQNATNNKLFAASGTGIYDATANAAVGGAVVTGQTSARNQSCIFGNASGNYLWVVNGADTPQVYNGTTWQQVTTVSSPIALTGGPATLSNLIQAYSWQGRLLFIEKNTCKFHYLASGAISGALSTFDLSTIFRLGGNLVAFADWNALTMTGPQDYAAFISSVGEVLIYQGYDPSLPGAWSLTGRFRIGRPIGNRPVVKVGADVYVITADGLVPLSAMQMDERSQIGVESITTKIQNAVNSDVLQFGSNFGWDVILHPLGNKLILNVPHITNQLQYQYVRNQITGAWTVFQGWNGACWALLGDQLFYGGNQVVVQADTGEQDAGNMAITTDLVPAFNYFGDETQNKMFMMFRAVFNSDAPVSARYAFCTDFQITNPTAALSAPGAGGSPWNTSPWNTSPWALGLVPRFSWQGGYGVGFNASLRLQTTSNASIVQLYSIDYAWQPSMGIML